MGDTSTADYLVGQAIGEGTFGKVVYAQYKATRKDVAIKIIPKLIIQKDRRLLSSVFKEKQLLMELKSRYVVPLLACFHDSQCLYFVMECASGGNLLCLISNGLKDKPSWCRSIPTYGLQLLAALEFAHSRNVLHADLKPDNVLVMNNKRLVLADFGSAISLNELSTVNPDHMGTTDYASPEVVRGVVSTFSVGIDLWSFGCVLYAMWEGASPFHDKSHALAINRIVTYDVEQELVAKNMTSSWISLVRNLLTPEPSKRYGVKDFDQRFNSNVKFEYRTIRDHSHCWKESDIRKLFQGPKPKWFHERNKLLQDGKQGWSVFML